MFQDVRIELITERCCDCGRYYAHEPGPHTCPRCRRDQVVDLLGQVDVLKRTISRLKGALTRARNRRGPHA